MPFNDWSDKEAELIIADYFSMLKDEIRGVKFSKTRHREALMPLLNSRSHGSVEFKHQNISAVLIEMGLPFIRGYKPRYNFQKAKLIHYVERYIDQDMQLPPVFYDFARAVPESSHNIDFTSWLSAPPVIHDSAGAIQKIRRPVKINYLEMEQRNRDLGAKGEELAVAYERYSLISAGKDALADRVEWVSRDQGDGLGFDILSKYTNGRDKYIEVKTTKLTKESPFFFSSNEFQFSIENDKSYHLYRIFNFTQRPEIFVLHGRFDSFCKIEPASYIGRF